MNEKKGTDVTDEAKGETQTEEIQAEQSEAGEEQSAEPTKEPETSEPKASESEASEPEKEEEVEEVVISIGEEAPPPKDEPAPTWVKELRKSHRELQRRNRELEAKLQATNPAPQPVVVGKKPTLEECDYDADKFEKSLADWFDRKRKADEVQARVKQMQETQEKEWQNRLATYAKAKNELRVSDFEEAEAAVTETFSVTQQGMIVQGADNPHHVVYALGKNPKKAKELAAISDPVKFAFAVAKLEAQLKVSSRKPSAAPEKAVSGTGRVAGAVDSTLERLRAEAEKTGNYSKVIAYKNSRRKSG